MDEAAAIREDIRRGSFLRGSIASPVGISFQLIGNSGTTYTLFWVASKENQDDLDRKIFYGSY